MWKPDNDSAFDLILEGILEIVAGLTIFILVMIFRMKFLEVDSIGGFLDRFMDVENGSDRCGILFVLTIIFISLGAYLYKGVELLKKGIAIKRVKKYKEMGGVPKKLKITGFYEAFDSRKKFDGYYFEVKNGEIVYRSKVFREADLYGLLPDEFNDLLKKYNIKEDNRDNIIKIMDSKIDEINEQISKASFLKRWRLKNITLRMANSLREELKQGSAYLEINDKKIYVGDEVLVYINPEDPNSYRIDTDFLD